MQSNVVKKHLQIQSLSITWEIKNVKNINLRISSSGEVIVSSNEICSQEQIEAFIMVKYDWIVNKVSLINNQNDVCNYDRKHIVLFGKRFDIKLSKGKENSFKCSKRYFHVVLNDTNSFEKQLDEYLNDLIYAVCDDILYLVHKNMKNYYKQYPIIEIKKYNRKWGCCYPSQNRICLNNKLIHYPVEFIEYVVLHEFVHFVYPNHSKDFYNLIEQYMPDYKRRMNIVKNKLIL